MNPFDGMNDAPPSVGGAYLVPGNYDLEIVEVKLVKSQRESTMFFAAEFDVLASNVDEVKVGSKRSWVANFKHKSTLSNIKHFLAAALDVEFDDVDEDVSKACVDEDQPLKGVRVRAEAFNVKTKQNRDFTKVKWEHLAEAA